MAPGEIVVFAYRKGLRIGRWVDAEAGKVRIAVEKDKTYSVPAANVLLATGAVADTPAALERFQREVDELSGSLDLREVWQLVSDDGELLSFDDIADLCFGDSPGALERAAVLWHLHGGASAYFEPRGSLYGPRRREDIETALDKRRRRDAEAEEDEGLLAWLWGERASFSPERLSARQRSFLDRIERFVVEGDESVHAAWAKGFLSKGRARAGSARRTAFRLLVGRGVFGPDEHLALRRLEVPRDFPPEVLAGATAYRPEPVMAAPGRTDLRHLEVFTVDDETTTDIDDGFSLEETEEGYRLGIHITDLSRAVPAGSDIDRAARSRVTSLYFPDEKIPMLPPAISSDTGSLVEEAPRPTVSLLLECDRRFSIRRRQVVLSCVTNRRRLSYGVADRILRGEPDPLDGTLRRLEELTAVLRSRRLKDGAIELDRPELDIKVAPDGTVSVAVRPADSPSGRLVAELMVLFNVELACFANDEGLPIIYRTQDPLDPDDATLGLPEPLRSFRLLKEIGPTALSLEARPHHLLGVAAYAQVSSPLRRYGDLALQRQFVRHLEADAVAHDREDVTGILYAIEERGRELGRLEGQRKQYWVLKYFESLLGERFRATLLEARGRDGLIELEELPLRAPMLLVPGTEAGEKVEAELAAVDPFEGVVRFVQR